MINFGFADNFFVVDIADTPNGVEVVELNCASSSGLYHDETEPLILEFEKQALRKWNEYYGEI